MPLLKICTQHCIFLACIFLFSQLLPVFVESAIMGGEVPADGALPPAPAPLRARAPRLLLLHEEHRGLQPGPQSPQDTDHQTAPGGPPRPQQEQGEQLN